MEANFVIAIDGPAGAGKSTVAKILAAKLSLSLLDTGAMYRCIAIAACEKGMDESAGDEALATLTRTCRIRFEPGQPQSVFLNDVDVTTSIRTLEIGQLASAISVHPSVRRVLVSQQQAIVRQGRWVLEGRDITTVVAPHAQVKVFLTASIEERARRRWLEAKERGQLDSLQSVVKDVVIRDHRDYTRDDSPLTLAEDAIIIESFGLTPEQVAEKIAELSAS